MASQSPHHLQCCCCGTLVSWATDDTDAAEPATQRSVESGSPTALGGPPTIGSDPVEEDAPEPDGGVQLPPPIPNPVCRDCATTATTTTGDPIDPPPTAPEASEPPATVPDSGPNPVVVDGVTCWRVGTGDRWQLARDAVGCDSARAFLRRHTDADGTPLRWFGIDHRGSPRQIRIDPDSVVDLLSFCEPFGSDTAFEIETALSVSSIKPPVVDLQRATECDSTHDTQRMSALTAEPAPRRIVVSIDAVETIAVVPEPTVSPPDPAATQQLDRYGQLAAVAPGVIDPSGLETLLRTTDPQTRSIAVSIVESVLAATATSGLTAISSLVDCLDAGRVSTLYALRSLAHIAELYPDMVAEEVDPVIDTVTADSRLVASAATRLLLYIAEHNPGAVVDALPAFGSLLAPTPTRARRQAVATVGLLANPHPEAVRPLVPQLCSLLDTDDTAYRISSTAALGRVTAAYPAAATPAVPTLVAQLDADHPELRANAVGVLGDIAREFPIDIAPYVDTLAVGLTDDDPTVRSNTAGAVARIASVKPRQIKPFTDALIALLDDEWTRSRVHACWALGRCGATAAAAALAECRHTDPEASVRQRAAWALDRIE